VILISCNTGGVNQPLASFAERILQQRLAKTVFAKDDLVDARDLPDLLSDLAASHQPIRQVLQNRGFLQIVVNGNGLAMKTAG